MVWTGLQSIGETQATPTTYTVLGRLKALIDGIILATSSNIIGRVGHDKTNLADGVTVVTTAGTDVTLAASTVAKVVIIQAQTDNTSAIAVGASGVDATVATGTGILLYAGEWTPWIPVDNLADIYIDSLVNGEGVRYIYLT